MTNIVIRDMKKSFAFAEAVSYADEHSYFLYALKKSNDTRLWFFTHGQIEDFEMGQEVPLITDNGRGNRNSGRAAVYGASNRFGSKKFKAYCAC
jgi:hypothetical protein